ncbi:ABC transporter substrate-binding protein [Streptomyces sp. B1866]|uniref:ABC transporter substrate-binding protein n=1 Tax=Streptomyces sp. B1866 TaxID=3075431 RepID=UPI002891AC15|nr:ABC transporter substrate-binding protein [Streptomyces sp. B1866]MDT3399853.1 ABC transporter substrate-binding protein [Streptomyces sp. B1866]
MRFVRTTGARRRAHRITGAAVASALALVTLTSCAGDPADGGGEDGGITVGLTYQPNIQFAPFYVAKEKGYFEDAGIDVKLRHHGAAEDLFGALNSGREDLVYAGGDEMLQARSNNVPIVDVATVYRSYPVGLIVPAGSDIREPKDLKGHTVGTPGPYGETYFGLLALLNQGGLSKKDVKVQYIGFTQATALAGHKVDAVMGYVNNDAVAFRQAGRPVRTIAPGPDAPLVGVGLGARRNTLGRRAEDVCKVVAATLRGVREVVDHPEEAVRISENYVPGLDDAKRRANALAVLEATRPLLRTEPGGRPGYNDPAVWERMADFMSRQGLLEKPVTARDGFDNAYLPKP